MMLVMAKKMATVTMGNSAAQHARQNSGQNEDSVVVGSNWR